MDRDLASCLACDAAVPATATACPDCSYDVACHERWRLLLGAAGMAMSLSLVLAPVGLPLLWRARHHQLAARGTVSRRDDSALGDHLRRVLRHHLGLTPSSEVRGDFFRGASGVAGEATDVSHGPR